MQPARAVRALTQQAAAACPVCSCAAAFSLFFRDPSSTLSPRLLPRLNDRPPVTTRWAPGGWECLLRRLGREQGVEGGRGNRGVFCSCRRPPVAGQWPLMSGLVNLLRPAQSDSFRPTCAILPGQRSGPSPQRHCPASRPARPCIPGLLISSADWKQQVCLCHRPAPVFPQRRRRPPPKATTPQDTGETKPRCRLRTTF